MSSCFCMHNCRNGCKSQEKAIQSWIPQGLPQKESGFFEDIPKYNFCQDSSHNAPTHMVIPYGKMYRHICPSCKKEQIIQASQVIL